MSNDNPNIERPVPQSETHEGELRIERRSAGHAALQALETVGGQVEATLVTLGVTGAALKIVGALTSNDKEPPPPSESKD
jgi:hypothetical protein